MDFLTVTVETLSPVVLTAMNNATVMTETRDYISGAVLRGVIASRYIEQKKLGKAAELDAGFRHLFFNSLRFIHAYPMKAEGRAFPLPFSLQKDKLAQKNAAGDIELLDVLKEAPRAGFKAVDGFGIVVGKKILPIVVNKQVKLHMSRSSETERLSGRSLQGGIYNYEAIEAGQRFQGMIAGKKEDLEQLLEILGLTGQELNCYIGRSKYTEYGRCKMTFGEVTSIPTKSVQGNRLYLRLETPWIPLLGCVFNVENIIEPFVNMMKEKLGDESITLGKVIGKAETVSNFVCIWGMKRSEQQAIAAGSVLRLQKAMSWIESDSKVLIESIHKAEGARLQEGGG